ncbi:hypothetical protein Tco_1410217 [Tanacetum coccineum]
MRVGELHKFSDDTLDDVRSALNDIAKGIRMEYLPKRKWSGLDKRRAQVMMQDIDQQLYERRLMRNLEKLVNGREYKNDLRCKFSTTVHSPQVTPIFSSVQQTQTPIPTPPITTDAPTVTNAVPESNALTTIELRVVKLEKDLSELKTFDLSSKALAILQSQVPIVVDILIEDENVMDKGVADTVKDHKRKHAADEDDDDEDPPAKPNQGKKTKRRRTEESESSKKSSTSKETSKGKAPTKGSKTGKSDSAKELVEEPIAEVVMDDAGDDVARDDYQPQDTSKPKTRKTLNPE